MTTLNIQGLLFDEVNEAKMSAHNVTPSDVLEVLLGDPEFFENLEGRRAPYAMLGPTTSGRMLLVPIEPIGDLWRPVTAFEPRLGQVTRYKGAE